MQLTIEVIKALVAGLIRVGIPPVGDGDLRVVGRNGECLPDTIITAHVAA